VIESLTQDCLDQGMIRSTSSPFAAPVVMVEKKDRGWRICIDCGALNKATIQDKFLIPLVEELID